MMEEDSRTIKFGFAPGALVSSLGFVIAGVTTVVTTDWDNVWAIWVGWAAVAVGVLILVFQITIEGRIWWQKNWAGKASSLSKSINELVTAYQNAAPMGHDWFDQDVALRQHESASRRLLQQYRTEYQADVLLIIRRAEKSGIDVSSIKVLAEYPTNPLGVEKIAREIAILSFQL